MRDPVVFWQTCDLKISQWSEWDDSDICDSIFISNQLLHLQYIYMLAQSMFGEIEIESPKKGKESSNQVSRKESVAIVQTKLLSFPEVQGLVFGSFGEASEAVHITNLVA